MVDTPIQPGSPSQIPAHDLAAEFYKAYEEHSKVLRTWLVAYGVGAPVLFLTNDSLAAKLGASAESGEIGGLFLGGVAFQVFLAVLNKTVMWPRATPKTGHLWTLKNRPLTGRD